MFLRGARSSDKRVEIIDTRGPLVKRPNTSHRGSTTTRRYVVENGESPKIRTFINNEEAKTNIQNVGNKEQLRNKNDVTLAKIPRYSKSRPSTRDAQRQYNLQRMEKASISSHETLKPKLPVIEPSLSSPTKTLSSSSSPYKNINKGKHLNTSLPPPNLPPLASHDQNNVHGKTIENELESPMNSTMTDDVTSTPLLPNTIVSNETKPSVPSLPAPSHTLMFEDKKSFWRVKRNITYRVFESLSVGAVVIRAFDHTINEVTNTVILDRSRILAQVLELEEAGASVPFSEHDRIVSFMVNRIEAEVDKETKKSKILISKRPSDSYHSLSFTDSIPTDSENIGVAVAWPSLT